MVNEAVACLDDGVVANADLLDAGVIFGTGFAPFRGGTAATTPGTADCLRLRSGSMSWQSALGVRFAPSRGWSGLSDVLTFLPRQLSRCTTFTCYRNAPDSKLT